MVSLIDWPAICWLFAAAITLHNTEEGIWLPTWSQQKGYWRISATVTEARLVLALLTVFAWISAWLAAKGSTFGIYLVCGGALLMLLNVFLPHLIATIALRQYAPGTATALLFNLPLSCRLLFLAITEKRISTRTFAWAGPAVVALVLAVIPLLFFLTRHAKKTIGLRGLRQEPGQ